MGRRSFLGELCSVPDHLAPHSVAVDLTDNLGPHVVAVGMPPLPRLVPDRATPAACHSAQRVRRPGEPADSSAGSNVDITASPEGSGLGDTWANMIGNGIGVASADQHATRTATLMTSSLPMTHPSTATAPRGAWACAACDGGVQARSRPEQARAGHPGRSPGSRSSYRRCTRCTCTAASLAVPVALGRGVDLEAFDVVDAVAAVAQQRFLGVVNAADLALLALVLRDVRGGDEANGNHRFGRLRLSGRPARLGSPARSAPPFGGRVRRLRFTGGSGHRRRRRRRCCRAGATALGQACLGCASATAGASSRPAPPTRRFGFAH